MAKNQFFIDTRPFDSVVQLFLQIHLQIWIEICHFAETFLIV